MLRDDREGVALSEAPNASLTERMLPEHVLSERVVSERASDELAVPLAEDESEHAEPTGEEREWFGKHPAYPRNTPEHLQTPDLQTRLYVGLWLPGAGALLTYAILRGNYWAAFVGIELLLVGWFTLAKL